jgi:hypothetical protein
MKDSGLGREGGSWSLEFFTETEERSPADRILTNHDPGQASSDPTDGSPA